MERIEAIMDILKAQICAFCGGFGHLVHKCEVRSRFRDFVCRQLLPYLDAAEDKASDEIVSRTQLNQFDIERGILGRTVSINNLTISMHYGIGKGKPRDRYDELKSEIGDR